MYCNVVIILFKFVRLLLFIPIFFHYQPYSYAPVTSNLKLPFIKVCIRQLLPCLEPLRRLNPIRYIVY